MTTIEDMHQILEDAIKEKMPSNLKEKGWTYLDPPGKFSLDAWSYFLDWLGEGEYQVLIMSEGGQGEDRWKRGQLFVSSQALINLADKERGIRIRQEKYSHM